MYAVLHRANAAGKSITALVTAANPKHTDYSLANGRYGRQGIHPYCSTIAAPKPRTLVLAQSVIDGTALDETQGAQYFDNPLTQDILHKAKPYNEETGTGYRSSQEIAERRQKAGGTLVTIDGISTRFWR